MVKRQYKIKDKDEEMKCSNMKKNTLNEESHWKIKFANKLFGKH